MTQTIQPLKTQFKPNYELFTPDEIIERVRSEDNLCWALGWPIIKSEDILKLVKK